MDEKMSAKEMVDAMPEVHPDEVDTSTEVVVDAAEAIEPAVEVAEEPKPEVAVETTAEQQAEEFLETEVFGLKGKVSKNFADSIRGVLEGERADAREAKETANRLRDEAKAAMEEATRLRDDVQAHLDANPDFAKNWQRAEKQKKQLDEAADVASKLDKYIAEQEKEKSFRKIEAQVAELANKYKLPKNEVYDDRDVRRIAAENIERGQSLDVAYREAVNSLSAKLTKAGLALVKSKVDAGKKMPSFGLRAGAAPGKKPEPKLSPREMLLRHLKMNDKDLERFSG